jgi:hypothetical protein
MGNSDIHLSIYRILIFLGESRWIEKNPAWQPARALYEYQYAKRCLQVEVLE